jgi:hypothetical protein
VEQLGSQKPSFFLGGLNWTMHWSACMFCRCLTFIACGTHNVAPCANELFYSRYIWYINLTEETIWLAKFSIQERTFLWVFEVSFWYSGYNRDGSSFHRYIQCKNETCTCTDRGTILFIWNMALNLREQMRPRPVCHSVASPHCYYNFLGLLGRLWLIRSSELEFLTSSIF